MFKDEKLQKHLETSSSIKTKAFVFAEWNMNRIDNIFRIGNYRYRPGRTEQESTVIPSVSGIQELADQSNDQTSSISVKPIDDSSFLYKFLIENFDPNDEENEIKFYTGATLADIVVDGGIDDDGQTPIVLTSVDEKEKLYYSLEDCFNRFRPRSGINKVRFFNDKYTHHDTPIMPSRPRYYLSHKDDVFKYWTSYRRENNFERGIANRPRDRQHYIDDAAPFVVYKKPIPSNRIVVKMQTNVGTKTFGQLRGTSSLVEDPLFGDENKTTPVRWKIQILKNNSWVDASVFDENSFRRNGSPIIGPDGYVELHYGLIIPERYRDFFKFVDKYASEDLLPSAAKRGDAYLVSANETDRGEFFVFNGQEYESFVPQYGWTLDESEYTVDVSLPYVVDLTNPSKIIDQFSPIETFREFDKIEGIRIAVETMNKRNSTFDLIEMSPRLAVDLTDRTVSFQFEKTVADLGEIGLPVGELLASNGNLTIFDFDQAFSPNNENSVLFGHNGKNFQIKFFEKIEDADDFEYYVPLKTMYAEEFPEASSETKEVSLELRDLFFYFESLTATEMLIPDTSLSYAIATLLDSVGFSNYVFFRSENEADFRIPYFFVPSEASVAEVLQDLAISSQSAMFFDEYNNLVIMSKKYLFPEEGDRETDLVLRGSEDLGKQGLYKNKTTESAIANIVSLKNQKLEGYNAGKISYITRYIQKSFSSIDQANFVDQDKNWIYTPVLLWESSGEGELKPKNNESDEQTSYVLSAISLNSDLGSDLPSVANNRIVNNTIDLGEGVYWIARYQGYFHLNAEIIRYDAVEFDVSGIGNVWISSSQEYADYFAKLPFNGKIYPTGLIRIFSEPFYEEVLDQTRLKNGPVNKHGRGQFGTNITKHVAGLDPYWRSNKSVRGIDMDSTYLFSKRPFNLSSVNSFTLERGSATFGYNQQISTAVKLSNTRSASRIVLPNHGFRTNNSFFFSSSEESLPSGIERNKAYFARSVTDDNFAFSAVSGGASITLPEESELNVSITYFIRRSSSNVTITVENPAKFTTSTNHNLQPNDAMFFTTTGRLPAGVIPYKIYYVKSVFDKRQFSISETRGGQALTTTATPRQTGTHTFTRISFPTMVNLSGHRFGFDDGVRFSTTGRLPVGIVRNQTYRVSKINLSPNSFCISEAEGGVPIVATPPSLIETRALSLDVKLVSDNKSTRINLANHGFRSNQPFYFTSGSASSMPSGLSTSRVYFARSVSNINSFTFSGTSGGSAITINEKRTRNVKIITFAQGSTSSATISIANVARFTTSSSHGLKKNDVIFFTTTGSLPSGVAQYRIYYVKSVFNNTQFSISRTKDGTAVSTTGSQSGNHSFTRVDYSRAIQEGIHTVRSNLSQDTANGLLFVPSTSKLEVGQKLEMVSENTGSFATGDKKTLITSIDPIRNRVRISVPVKSALRNATVKVTYAFDADIGNAGISNTLARNTTRNGIIKNFLSFSSISDDDINNFYSTKSGTVQSSALVMNGQTFTETQKPIDFISYVYKRLDEDYDVSFNHFGTRMRIIGRIKSEEDVQEAIGSIPYFSRESSEDDSNRIAGSSGGLAVMINPLTNNGYFFEIIAADNSTFQSDNNRDEGLFNVVFYKNLRDNKATRDSSKSIPVKLWSGVAPINTDSGDFVGQHRLISDESTSVYDLSVEYVKKGSRLVFYLYINYNLVGVVEDPQPLPISPHMGLFVRGSARCMFEHLYALKNDERQQDESSAETQISVEESSRKYSINEFITKRYLNTISSLDVPKSALYFEEFGTILREMSYFNIRYDKAYPALSAIISPTFNALKGYSVAGFVARSYGAEFLIFNNTDTVLDLDAESGNYLRIQGVAFTQEADNEISIDDYFIGRGNLSDPQVDSDNNIISPIRVQKEYQGIKNQRILNGRKEFNLSAPYIQSKDAATGNLEWLIDTITKDKEILTVEIFGMPLIQLGDLVRVDYINKDGIKEVDPNKRFIVYNISYSRASKGPSMILSLCEVV
jgi:hypothetical protein